MKIDAHIKGTLFRSFAVVLLLAVGLAIGFSHKALALTSLQATPTPGKEDTSIFISWAQGGAEIDYSISVLDDQGKVAYKIPQRFGDGGFIGNRTTVDGLKPSTTYTVNVSASIGGGVKTTTVQTAAQATPVPVTPPPAGSSGSTCTPTTRSSCTNSAACADPAQGNGVWQKDPTDNSFACFSKTLADGCSESAIGKCTQSECPTMNGVWQKDPADNAFICASKPTSSTGDAGTPVDTTTTTTPTTGSSSGGSVACGDGTTAVDATKCASVPDAAANGGNCSDINQCDLFAKYLNPFIRLMSALVGVIVVISIILGGIQYGSSAGDPQKATQAKARIRNSIIALLVFLFLYAILNFVIPGGLFHG